VIVARLLGPEAFGAIALIAAYPALVFGILNVRTGETTTRFLAGYERKGSRLRALGLCKVAYSIDVTVAALAFAIVAVTVPWVGPRVLSDPRRIALMTVYALSFVPNAFGPTSNAILVVTSRFLLTGSLDIGRALLRAALVIGLVAAGWGIPGVIYGTVVANTTFGVATVVVAHWAAARHWDASWLWRGWAELAGQRREITRFFVLSDLSALFTIAIKTADVLILAHFRPTVEIGYYNLGKSLTTQLVNLVGAVRVVAFPQVVRLWTAGAWDALWSYVRSHTLTFGLLGISGTGVLMLAVEPAIALVYGPAFTPAAAVARLLLLQVVLLLLTMWVDMVFLAWGDMHIQVLSRSLGAAITVGGIYLFAGRWGIAAAALALLTQQFLSMVITFTWMYAHRHARALEAATRRDRDDPPGMLELHQHAK
jgi:O-antigen/teichoic acid export membrane protein